MNIPRPIFYVALLAYFGTMICVGLTRNTVTTGIESLYALFTAGAAVLLGLITFGKLNACRSERVVHHSQVAEEEQEGLQLRGFGVGDYGLYLLIVAFSGYNLFEHLYINTISTGALSLGTAVLSLSEVGIVWVALSQTWDMLTAKVSKFARTGTSVGPSVVRQ